MLQKGLSAAQHASLRRFPAVGLFGSRQCGKTTLARALAAERFPRAVYLDLERPSDLAKLADPEAYLESHRNRLPHRRRSGG